MNEFEEYMASLSEEDLFQEGEQAYQAVQGKSKQQKVQEAAARRNTASNAEDDYVDPYVDEMPWGDKVAMGVGQKVQSLVRRAQGMFGTGPGESDEQKRQRDAMVQELGIPGTIGYELPGAVAGASAGGLMHGAKALQGWRTGRKVKKYAEAADDVAAARSATAGALRRARGAGLRGVKVPEKTKHMLKTLEKSKDKARKKVVKSAKWENRIPGGPVGAAATSGAVAGAIGSDENPALGAAGGAALAQAGPLAKGVAGAAARAGQSVLARGYRGPKLINLIARKTTDLPWEFRSELAQNRALNRILRGKPVPEHESKSLERLMTILKLPPHIATNLTAAGYAGAEGEEMGQEMKEALAELRSLLDAP